jgi:hypothetical protein
VSTTIPNSTRKQQPRTEPIFYTYLYRRNGIPFYIGKGHDARINAHESCALKNASCKHRICRVIRKEHREGGIITKEKIAEGIPEQAAFNLECLFISLGAIYEWPLVNQTLGGEGVSGYIRDAEWSKRRSELFKQLAAEGKYDYLKTLDRSHLRDPKIIEKRSESIRRTANTSEYRDKKRQLAIEVWKSPEHREKQRQGMKQAFANHPEMSEGKSERAKRQWEDPGFRKRRQEAQARPEVREKMRQGRLGKLPPNTKTYPGFVSPDGTLYKDVYNLADFCKKHGLSKSKMCLVSQGKRTHHRGWTKHIPEQPQQGHLF